LNPPRSLLVTNPDLNSAKSQGKAMRIRVTTRAHLFEERKRQHIERGYRIEDERPIPVNGMCSFIAVKDLPVQDTLSALVAEAVNGNRGRRTDW
jgi:hypothetical protein